MRNLILFSMLLFAFKAMPTFADDAAAPPAAVASGPETDTNLPGVGVKDNIKTEAAQLTVKETQELANQTKLYLGSVDTCVASRNKAVLLCDESKSSVLNNVISTAQKYGGAIASLTSAFDSCSQISQAMKEINAGLKAYQGLCSAAKSICDGSCGTATKAATAITESFKATDAQLTAKIDELAAQGNNDALIEQYLRAQDAARSINKDITQELSPDQKTVSARKTRCEGFVKQLAGAGQQIAGDLQTLGKSNNCADATNGTGKSASADNSEAYCRTHPSEAQCSCNITTNSNTARCLCEKDPRNPTCGNGLAAAGSQSTDLMKAGNPGGLGSASKTSATTPDFNLGSDPAGITLPQKTADEAGPGGKGGGGGFMGGGGGGGNQMGAAAGGSAGAGVAMKGGSTSGGFMGGGGGGAGRMPGSDEDSKNPLRQYLPGQEKDPLRKISGMASGEVSGKDGKSNWEKIQSRYRDNIRTLMGN